MAIAFLLAFLSFTLTRVVLAFSVGSAALPWSQWPLVFAKGLFFDAATLAYICPILLVLTLLPGRVFLTLWIAFLAFLAAAEITFWIEFTTRFNFIALDYLIYTNEVLRNIWQSYPVVWILCGIALVSAGMSHFIHRHPLRKKLTLTRTPPVWAMFTAGAIVIPALSFHWASIEYMYRSGNTYAQELSGNGLFTLASAAHRNSLDYDRNYVTIPQEEADRILKDLGVEWTRDVERRTNDRWGNDRIEDPPPFLSRRPKNIVLVSVESLSADFLGTYGSKEGLTPELDALAAKSIVFENIYAVGTRTVRGLEALSLGIPPVPGQSIIRRPENSNLATIGDMLDEEGFKVFFIYGGYGYFDNMNAYFKANDYTVIDRTDFPSTSVEFENVWGVADESLYSNTLEALDQAFTTKKRFFAHVMTTSNHRPYTYPQGRIDIASPGGRRGAVKYTDFALGEFIRKAQQKPWFKDTLFVLTADHCASVAGKTELPVAKYRIPLLFYGPALLKPQKVTHMYSQIDIIPTLMDVLGVPGDDNFFGKEMNEQSLPARAFISNYQSLGYYKEGHLVVLKPRQKVEGYTVNPQTLEAVASVPSPRLVREAIAYYQTASRAFKDGQLRLLWR